MDKTIIISDIHLGSNLCQAAALRCFLNKLDCQRLILNGDVFESMDFRRLKKHHWHVLSLLRKLSDHMEVVWVCGNHDGPAEIVSHLIGVEVVDEFIFTSGEQNVLVCHGHIYDTFLDEHPILTIVGDIAYNFLQWIDKSHYIARMAKHNSKHYLRCSQAIKDGALKLAHKKQCNIVCTGHTHNATEDNKDGIRYLNSGCWTEKPCHYIEINENSAVIREFNLTSTELSV